MDVQAAYLGDRLGYYQALAGGETMTAADLAGRTGTAERYAREWLEQQAVTDLLVVDDMSASPDRRRYSMPRGHVEVLTDSLSPNHVLPLARMIVGLGKQMEALVEAYRTGGGVPWHAHGADVREGQAAANRPLFLGVLGSEYFPSISEVDSALRAGGRMADIGCGLGWSSIGIARAYPDATVHGYDLDGPSIEAARRNAKEAGVADRVTFHATGADLSHGTYDVVAAFECIHDMPDPVSVLSTMRSLAGRRGTVLVMDERVAEEFTAPGDEVERLMYGWSLMCCLADSMSTNPSVATGTVMRPSILREYALAAGFQGVEILDINDDFFRFYRLA